MKSIRFLTIILSSVFIYIVLFSGEAEAQANLRPCGGTSAGQYCEDSNGNQYQGLDNTYVSMGFREDLKWNWAVENVGTSSSGSFTVHFGAATSSSNCGTSNWGYWLTSISLNSIQSGYFSSGTTQITVPDSLPPDDYYLCMFVDSTGSVSESNEYDNVITDTTSSDGIHNYICNSDGVNDDFRSSSSSDAGDHYNSATTLNPTSGSWLSWGCLGDEYASGSLTNTAYDNEDWYKVYVSSGNNLQVDMRGDYSTSQTMYTGGSNHNFNMVLRNPSGTIVDTSGGSSSTECVSSTGSCSSGSSSSTAATTGYWLVGVTRSSGNGHYQLKFTQVPITTKDIEPISSGTNFPTTGVAGDSVSNLRVYFKNNGNAASGSFAYRTYLSTNTQITTSDHMVCNDQMYSLSGGQTSYDTCSGTLPTTPGTYYWGVMADPSDAISESNENNNVLQYGSITISADTDLIPISAGSSFPSSGTAGDSVSGISVSIRNDGTTSTSTSVGYRVYLSTDTVISTSDHLICTDSVSSSIGGNSYRTDNSCTGTLPTSSGTYYWGVFADHSSSISETSESNNIVRFGTISISPQPTINLVPTSSGSSFPSSGNPGDSVSVTTKILNEGNSASGSFSFKVYLSTDSSITSSDTLFCSASMSSIPAGSSETKLCNGNLPSSTGTYYWGVIADTSSSISETSESDNTQRFNSISISEAPTINLVPTSSGSTFPSTGEPGDSVSVTTKILNEGNTNSGSFTYKVYLSTDNYISESDTVFCTKTMNSIYAGSSRTLSCSGNLPSSSGNFYWGVIADTSSSISETSESDNSQTFNMISISEEPTINLVPTSSGSNFPSTGQTGDSVTVTTKILNEGNSASGSFTYKVYLSTDTYISASDTLFCSKTMNSISAGSSGTISCIASLPDSTGNYYWGVIADTDSEVSETSESDNTQRFNSISVSSGSEPDSDGDGVPDDNDNCPNTQSGAQVDSNGCESTSSDSDGDGVLDSEDDCPNTPSGEQVDSNGCTISSNDDLDIRLDIKGMENCDCISDGNVGEEIRIPYAIANNGQDSVSNVGLSIYAVQGSVMEFPGTGNLICDQTEFVDDKWVTGGTCTASFNSPGIYTFFAVLSAPEGTINGPSEVRMDWAKISTPVNSDSTSTAGESESSNSVLPTLATIGFILLLLGGIAFVYTRRDELDWLPSFSGETSQMTSNPSTNMELSSYELPPLPENFNINQVANANQAPIGQTPVYVNPNQAPIAQAPVYVDPNQAPIGQTQVQGDPNAGLTKTQKIQALTEQHNAGTITDETYHALLMSILNS